jgi:hypothetical protein
MQSVRRERRLATGVTHRSADVEQSRSASGHVDVSRRPLNAGLLIASAGPLPAVQLSTQHLFQLHAFFDSVVDWAQIRKVDRRAAIGCGGPFGDQGLITCTTTPATDVGRIQEPFLDVEL